MQTISGLFDEYGLSHRHPFNKRVHWICVPAILWSLLALLWSVPPAGGLGAPPLNWAVLAVIAMTIYYLLHSWRLAIGMVLVNTALLGLCAGLAAVLPLPLWQAALIVFVLAWIGQFIGHHVEGARPSFFKDLQFLLVGPAWLLGFVYRRFRLTY